MEETEMLYRVLADLVVAVHLAFVLFAVLGGLLVLRWSRCAWIHVPAALWAVFIELAGGVCPLTPLENWLRQKGGAIGYRVDFIEHYIVPVLYPTVLTRRLQITLGLFVLAVNLGIYGWWLLRRKKRRHTSSTV
ncbi:DUF2784 domain-containing protein [Acidobacteria bacterium AH-259-A15]|nr:DUF2784 domain-containing protein [Acidobacteria bacterium AH-259-A15]